MVTDQWLVGLSITDRNKMHKRCLSGSNYFSTSGQAVNCRTVAVAAPIKNKWAASWQNQQNDCAPSEDSDQPGLPHSLIRVFAVRMKKAWVLSYPLSAQRRLWSDWADAQADLSLRWAHSHYTPANFVCDGVYCFHVVRPSVRTCVRPWHFGFFLISWKLSDGYSSISADTLISIRCTYIRKSKG